MLNPDTGWINGVAGGDRHPASAGLARGPDLDLPGLVIMGIWGIGAGMIVYLAGLKGIPTDLYEAARIDGAGAWASLRHITIPMMSPVIFYTIVLGVVEVLQYFLVPLVLKNGTGEPGGSTMFFNLYLYKNFFTFQNMSYGATLAWLLFAITLGDHARPVRDGPPLGLLRRRGPMTGRSRPPRDRGLVRPAAAAAPRPGAARHASAATRRRSFLLTLIAVVTVAAFLSPMLRSITLRPQEHGPDHPGRHAALSGRPGDVLVPGQGAAAAPRPAAGRDDAGPWRCSSPAASRARSSTRPHPDAAPISWQGSWRTLEHVWQFAPHWENFGKVWDLIDYPRLLFNTAAIAVISTIGTLLSCTLVAYGFARFRFPGRNLLFTLLIATIFLPGAVTIIPTYTIFQKHRLGRARGCRSSCRRSSPTPTTCSSCASTS